MRNEAKKVKEHVYSMVANGEKLVSERKVAERFGLKRSVVRENFLSLEGEGFLKRVPQVGYEIIEYHKTDHSSLQAVRYTVEMESVKKAMENATREDIVRLSLIVEDMATILSGERDPESYINADKEFHEALVKASHDNMLIKIYSFITNSVFNLFSLPPNLQPTQSNHERILEALKKRDEDKLLQEMEKHLANFRKHENNS